jgi:hypothetical protein
MLGMIGKALAASLLASAVLAMPIWARSDQDSEDFSHRSEDFTNASFYGSYATVATYGANVARLLGIGHPDGKGNTHGTGIVNVPGPNGTRVIVSISYEGTYTVSPEGFGVVHYVVTLPNGTTALTDIDFLATKAKMIRGRKVITEFATAQREPSSVFNGEFVVHTGTRLPD